MYYLTSTNYNHQRHREINNKNNSSQPFWILGMLQIDIDF